MVSLRIEILMPYYFYHKSPIWHLNSIFYWKLDKLLLGVVIFEKLKNPLRGVFYYLYTTVTTPNEQPFQHIVIFPLYFCSDLSFLNFSYILFYFYYLDVDILANVIL